jgi:hypothetical protein
MIMIDQRETTLPPVLAEAWRALPTVRVRWSPGRMEVPEDENGECYYCHGNPGPAGCGMCGATGKFARATIRQAFPPVISYPPSDQLPDFVE